jgi:pantoate--beta-alanine ligase
VELIREPAEFRRATDAARAESGTVALVPTMGALHQGHVSLIRRAREEQAVVAVSIFVNPRQFARGEDLARYPRDEERDLEVCTSLGVELVWAPSVDQMYPPGEALVEPDPGPVGGSFEGASRLGHFRGVLTVVHRLFDVTGPAVAYFGQKDAQQVFLVRRMVRADALPMEIVVCPIVREPDGLALSSRNTLLAPREREQAGCLFLGLSEAAALARAGERDAHVLVAALAREVGATPLARLDYAAVVDDETFTAIDVVDRPATAIVAASFPSARLIDNLALPPAPASS